MEYQRELQKHIETQLFKNKVIIIYGARRVGKTFLCKQILKKYENTMYVNCEFIQYKHVLESINIELLSDMFKNKKLVVLDEAQNIKNIGQTLKILIDTLPEIQIIATGSSSFQLADSVSEPLTGRSRIYLLLPFSFSEVLQKYDIPTLLAKLPNILRFGLYPDVFEKAEDEAKEELYNIASNYLYKDVLLFEKIKKADLVINLLRCLALQLGSEVSYNEIASLLSENVHTIKRYIELLEKNFVIFRLKSFSRNNRNEIAKGQKIYFYDLGICNAIINNFNPPEIRADKGGLWENFCIIERLKFIHNNRIFANQYFMRTTKQQEIDYIEEINGQLNGYEFKYVNQKNTKIPKFFLETYPNSTYEIFDNQNIYKFLIK